MKGFEVKTYPNDWAPKWLSYDGDDKRPLVLVTGDDPRLCTGFGVVVRHILHYLQASGKFRVACLGLYSPRQKTPKGSGIAYPGLAPVDVFRTLEADQDSYGQLTLPQLIMELRPEIVLTVGDIWMIAHVAEIKKKLPGFVWMAYTPIDSDLIPASWLDVFRKIDAPVVYGNFGKQVLGHYAPDLRPHVVPHGVNPKIYHPLDPDTRKKVRALMKWEGKKVGICVARNQPRKQLPRLMDALSILVNQLGLRDMAVYFHAPINDIGWDLREEAQRRGVLENVMFCDDLKVGSGVPDSQLAMLLGAADYFVTPTAGEGWMLPGSDSLACGTPVLAPNFSAYAGEFVVDGETGLLARVADYYIEPNIGVSRALVDTQDLARLMDRITEDDTKSYCRRWGIPESQWDRIEVGSVLRNRLGAKGREVVTKHYDWADVGWRWVNLVAAYTQDYSVHNFIASKARKKNSVYILSTSRYPSQDLSGAMADRCAEIWSEHCNVTRVSVTPDFDCPGPLQVMRTDKYTVMRTPNLKVLESVLDTEYSDHNLTAVVAFDDAVALLPKLGRGFRALACLADNKSLVDKLKISYEPGFRQIDPKIPYYSIFEVGQETKDLAGFECGLRLCDAVAVAECSSITAFDTLGLGVSGVRVAGFPYRCDEVGRSADANRVLLLGLRRPGFEWLSALAARYPDLVFTVVDDRVSRLAPNVFTTTVDSQSMEHLMLKTKLIVAWASENGVNDVIIWNAARHQIPALVAKQNLRFAVPVPKKLGFDGDNLGALADRLISVFCSDAEYDEIDAATQSMFTDAKSGFLAAKQKWIDFLGVNGKEH